MTPERRQEIEGLLARPIGHTSQREVSTLRKAVKELLAENATLKGEVERLRAVRVALTQPDDKWDGEKCRAGCGKNQRVAWAVTDKCWHDVTGDISGVLCLECFLKLCEVKAYDLRVTDFEFLCIGGATLIDGNVTTTYESLRAQRDALVTAAQNLGATRNDGYPVYDRVSPFMMDALAAAVAEAKGEK